jgi:hypothetical protein
VTDTRSAHPSAVPQPSQKKPDTKQLPKDRLNRKERVKQQRLKGQVRSFVRSLARQRSVVTNWRRLISLIA